MLRRTHRPVLRRGRGAPLRRLAPGVAALLLGAGAAAEAPANGRPNGRNGVRQARGLFPVLELGGLEDLGLRESGDVAPGGALGFQSAAVPVYRNLDAPPPGAPRIAQAFVASLPGSAAQALAWLHAHSLYGAVAAPGTLAGLPAVGVELVLADTAQPALERSPARIAMAPLAGGEVLVLAVVGVPGQTLDAATANRIAAGVRAPRGARPGELPGADVLAAHAFPDPERLLLPGPPQPRVDPSIRLERTAGPDAATDGPPGPRTWRVHAPEGRLRMTQFVRRDPALVAQTVRALRAAGRDAGLAAPGIRAGIRRQDGNLWLAPLDEARVLGLSFEPDAPGEPVPAALRERLAASWALPLWMLHPPATETTDRLLEFAAPHLAVIGDAGEDLETALDWEDLPPELADADDPEGRPLEPGAPPEQVAARAGDARRGAWYSSPGTLASVARTSAPPLRVAALLARGLDRVPDVAPAAVGARPAWRLEARGPGACWRGYLAALGDGGTLLVEVYRDPALPDLETDGIAAAALPGEDAAPGALPPRALVRAAAAAGRPGESGEPAPADPGPGPGPQADGEEEEDAPAPLPAPLRAERSTYLLGWSPGGAVGGIQGGAFSRLLLGVEYGSAVGARSDEGRDPDGRGLQTMLHYVQPLESARAPALRVEVSAGVNFAVSRARTPGYHAGPGVGLGLRVAPRYALADWIWVFGSLETAWYPYGSVAARPVSPSVGIALTPE